MKQTFTIGVFGIIRDEDDRVLLVLRNDYDLWNLPGGALEKGEAPWQGVVREVKEETGYDVHVVRLAGVYSKPDKDEVVFSFECKIISGEATLNEEAKEIKYFSFNEIPKNTSQKQVKRIKDLLENGDELIMKIQTGKSSIERINEKKLEKLKLGRYEHYKGGHYEVIGFARHSETLEELVIYKALYDSEEFGGNALWARPRSMFFESVNIDGREVPRFKYTG